MHDTWFTASPEWTIYIVPYFFVGGIAGGSYFLAAILHWFGRPEDRAVENLDESTANRLKALVTRVEFLGGLCIAEVTADALRGQTIGLHFSLNQLHDLDIREGNTIDIALRANRIRAFAARVGDRHSIADRGADEVFAREQSLEDWVGVGNQPLLESELRNLRKDIEFGSGF